MLISTPLQEHCHLPWDMSEEYSPGAICTLLLPVTVMSVLWLFKGKGYFVGYCMVLSLSILVPWMVALEHSKRNVFTWAAVQI